MSLNKSYKNEYQNLIQALVFVKNTKNTGIVFIESDNSENLLTYSELYSRAIELLTYLRKKGIAENSELVFQLDSNKDFIIAFWACILGKIIAVPVTNAINPESRLKLNNIWKQLNNPFLICRNETIKRLSEKTGFENNITEKMIQKSVLIEEIDTDLEKIVISEPKKTDIAFIQFSSGSTGDPKGVILTHENLLTNISAIINCSDLRESDCSIGWMPLTHDMGLIGFHLTPLVIGILQNLMPTNLFVRRPLLWMEKANEKRATFLASPNFGYKHFLSVYKVDFDYNWDLSCIRRIMNGAEPISVSLTNQFLKTLSKYGLKEESMFTVYGMAEASLAVTFPIVDQKPKAIYVDRNQLNTGEKVNIIEENLNAVGFMDVGFPVDDCEIRITDNNNSVLEEYYIGNIQIKGKNVTSGYYNNLEATQKLITNGWLNTGDLGFVQNNRLVITGREKDVIFFNGQNYYAHDIERITEELEEIELGKVVAYGTTNKSTQKEEILLFIQYRGNLEKFSELAKRIKTYINQKIALEITYVVPINNIPKTTSGKVQRFKLGQQYNTGEFNSIIDEISKIETTVFSQREYLEPTTETENKLTIIWETILGINKISVNDNFFELGGHSLKATMMVAYVQQEFKINLGLRDIFKTPTIQKLSKLIDAAENNDFIPIEVISDRNYYPLSSVQKRLYVLHKLDEESTAYHITAALSVEGEIDITKLQNAINELINKHEILRTSIVIKNEQPVQIVHKSTNFTIEKLEDTNLESLVNKFVRPFNLAKEPLFRIGILKKENHNILLFDMHHIISDGSSMGIIINELSALCSNIKLEKNTLNYKDFAVWQSEFFKTNSFKNQEKYWLKKLEGELPVLNLTTDFPRPNFQNYKGNTIQYSLHSNLILKLKELAFANNTTLFSVIMAAYNVLLYKYTGQSDIIVGTTSASRTHAQVQNMLGAFINMLAIRNYPTANQSFKDFLTEVSKNSIEAFDNQDYPIEQLVEKLNLERDLSRNPLFDTVIIYQNMELGKINLNGKNASILPIQTNTSKFDLTLEFSENNDVLEIKAEYANSLFNEDTIQNLLVHFENILIDISTNIDKEIAAINLLSEDEKNRILIDFNTTENIEINTLDNLSSFFESSVSKNPNQLICCNDQQITYKQLNEKANQIAQYLRQNGAAPNKVIAVLMNRNLDLICSIWGIIKSGAAYLPIDSNYPENRINFIIEDSKAIFVLSDTSNIDKFKLHSKTVDINKIEFKKLGTDIVEIVNKKDDLAYIIYTSGSTGNPKGVMIEHGNVLSFLPSLAKVYNFSSADSILALTTVSFDLSILELICSILNGLKVVIADDATISEPKLIANLIKKGEVNILQTTPSRLQLLLEIGGEDVFNVISTILVGGESLPESLYQKLKNIPHLTTCNVYGPTEDTVWSTAYNIKEGPITVGKPNIGEQIYIINPQYQIQPIGVPGEICIYSQGLSRGYLNAEELTNEKFVENPFKKGVKMYRTGDLGRWLPNGNIEYVGRIDFQVKIRGYRIELGEIENKLYGNKSVKKAVVIDRVDKTGFKYLCAYVVIDTTTSPKELKEELSKSLPEYMVPSYIIEMESIPLNNNGKVARKELPLPENTVKNTNELVLPSTKTEEELVNIWKEILNSKQLSTTDNFFEIGGNSLKGTILCSHIQKKMNIDIPLRAIFNFPTIAALAKYIHENTASSFEKIKVSPSQNLYPLTPSQSRIYVLTQLEKDSTSYNMPGAFVVKGNLDVEKLKNAFYKLVERHSILRTSFEIIDGEVFQKINEDIKLPFQYIESTETEAPSLLKDLIKPFDLNKSPLIRVALIKFNENQHLFLCDMHHIISDGFSTEILIKEFIELSSDNQLPDNELQYKDYAIWMQDFLHSDKIKTQENFWLNQLNDELPVLDLPTDFKRPPIQSFEGEIVSNVIDKETLLKLKSIVNKTATTPYMLFLAIYKVFLSKYTRQDDIIIGTPIAGRKHPDIQNMIGMFVNTLALRSKPESEKTFVQYLEEIKELVLNTYENQEYPFETLVEKLNLNRDLSRNPVFDSMFTYQDGTGNNWSTDKISFDRFTIDSGISKFDLSFDIIEKADFAEINVEYATALFRKETIQKIIKHFKNALINIADNPNQLIASIELIDTDEKNYILHTLNTTKSKNWNGELITELFANQVIKSPLEIALKYKNEDISYNTLNEKANKIANYLLSNGVSSETIIGVYLHPTPEMMYIILGILKSGAAYLPIDVSYPSERINFMLEDCKVKFVFTDDVYKNNLPTSINSISINQFEFDDFLTENPTVTISTTDLAYIIYTSGSTGNPKGVLIEHGNFADYVSTFIETVHLTQSDIILQHSSVAFDTSIEELFPILCIGGTLLIPNDRKDANELLNYIEKDEITALSTSPLMLNFINEEVKKLGKLRFITVGGDELKPSYINNLKNKITLYNGYGPTESTVCITYYQIKGDEIDMPIGKPLPNREVYILNKDLQLVPFGVAGELCVGGKGLARGYKNLENITAEKFIDNPYKKGEKIYRTGDLVKWLPDGNLGFYGRIDNQVKIRGFRIEIGEIERRIKDFSTISEVAVVVKEDEKSSKYLCAYISGNFQQDELINHLSSKLPDYMIPTYFVKVEKLPITSNGKLDKRALPAPVLKDKADIKIAKNDAENALLATFKEVLGNIDLSTDDNFFSVGGDSIKAIQIASRLKKYGYKLEIKDLFQNGTIEKIAPFLKTDKINAEQGIVEGEVMLTPIQLAFFEENLSEPNYYTQGIKIINKQPFNIEVLNSVLKQLIYQHDALRMQYKGTKQLNKGIEDSAEIVEIYPTDNTDTNAFINTKIKDAQQNLKLENKLFLALLFKTQNADILVLIAHHLVIDGVSWRILLEDLLTAYQLTDSNKKYDWPQKTTSYKEWATYLHKYATTDTVLKEISYWKKQTEVSEITFPTDFTPTENTYHSSDNYSITLNKQETNLLLKDSHEVYSTKINELLLSALVLAFNKWAGNNNLLLTLEGHGREELFEDIDINRTVGWFTSVFPLLLTNKNTIQDTIIATKETIRKIPNNGIGYGILKYLTPAELKQDLNVSVNPEISFNYLGQFEDEKNSEFEIVPLNLDETVSKNNKRATSIDINGMVINGELKMEFTFNTLEYKLSTISKLADEYKLQLQNVIHHCITKEEKEITPSDLSYSEIGIDELNDLFG